jgi:hypothetical protein
LIDFRPGHFWYGIFNHAEGRLEKSRQKRGRGSVFQGRIKLTGEEYPQVGDYLRSLLLPENIVVTFNGDRLLARKPLRTFEASLETPAADDEGVMRPRVRKTRVAPLEAKYNKGKSFGGSRNA